MEFVQRTVDDWSEDDSRNADEQNPAEQRVTTREKFPGVRLQCRDRTHRG